MRTFKIINFILLAAILFSILLQNLSSIPRGFLTDWMCQILPAYLYLPLAVAFIIWGTICRNVFKLWIVLPFVSLCMLFFLRESIITGLLLIFSGWIPGQ